MMKNPLNSSNVFSVSALVQPPQVMLVAFIAELGTYLKSYSTQYKSCLLGDITGFVTKRNNQNEKRSSSSTIEILEIFEKISNKEMKKNSNQANLAIWN